MDSTIETKYGQYGNKVSMFGTVKSISRGESYQREQCFVDKGAY